MFGHPLQCRVGDHDVGVSRRGPVAYVLQSGVEATSPRGVDHLRRVVGRLDGGLGPPAGELDREIAGAATEVDDPAGGGEVDAGEQLAVGPSAVIGEGQVLGGVPHDRSSFNSTDVLLENSTRILLGATNISVT